MASVTIDVGDTVEVSFKLKFKKAEVQRRPDRDSFQKIIVWRRRRRRIRKSSSHSTAT
ncbi:MAG: hypothetical protein R2882_06025 [Gemmatimonadales bacterium]